MSLRTALHAITVTAMLLAASDTGGATLGATFTYQGRLTDAGAPVHGVFDLELKLYDAASAGSQVGSTLIVEDVNVENGLFTVGLDFGAGVFGAEARWLEIGVRPGASTEAFTTLAPRQELTAVPTAQYAVSAGTVAGLACADGQVAKWSGSSWVCAADADTLYLAGDGLALVGTTLSVASGGITAGMIAGGQVTRSVNSLRDDVSIVGTGAASVTTAGSTVTVSVASPPTEVPAGSMLLGTPGDAALLGAGYDEVASTDILGGWTGTSATGAPGPRSAHTIVWTGSKMIVWGGSSSTPYLDTGGVYDPITNTWSATSTTGAPCGREAHTAVWTGSKMIIWGGYGDPDGSGPYSPAFLDTGAIYDPDANTWTTMETAGAPSPRKLHSAVWTGTRMIVWGGYSGGSAYHNTGAIYDPDTNTWTATETSGAPTARYSAAAVWTGSMMIIWGGYNHNAGGALGSGGKYDPGPAPAGAWYAVAASGAPSGRTNHAFAWTGSRLAVWGGWAPSAVTNTGGLYEPGSDSWTSMSTVGAPAARESASAVWTGRALIVWGGNDLSSPVDTGGIFDPVTGAWRATSSAGVPRARYGHRAVWTGTRMVLWGGYDGSQYLDSGGVLSPLSVYVKQ